MNKRYEWNSKKSEWIKGMNETVKRLKGWIKKMCEGIKRMSKNMGGRNENKVEVKVQGWTNGKNEWIKTINVQKESTNKKGYWIEKS